MNLYQQIVILTLIFEILTIFGRLVFGDVKEIHAKIKKRVYLPRIHHGYFGIALILLFLMVKIHGILILGLSLFFSDIIHHFLVLPIWIKETRFP